MRYLFTNGSDGNLNDPANWQPAGGPPVGGDIAVFRNGGSHAETLNGTASTGALEFYGGRAGSSGQGGFVLNSVTLDAAMPLGTQFVNCDATADNSSLTTSLLGVTGASLEFDTGVLQTGRTVIGTTAESGALGDLTLNFSTWTNTGGVVLSNSPNPSSSDIQVADLFASTSTLTIGGDLTADAGDGAANVVSDRSSMTVAGNMALSGSAALLAEDGGLTTIEGKLLVNGSGALGPSQALAYGAVINVVGDIVAGSGAQLLAQAGGLLMTEGALRILDGATGTVDAGSTIEANTIVLQPMAFLSGPAFGERGGPGIIQGGGGGTTILNQGTIAAQGSLTIDGSVKGQGTLLLGGLPNAAGDMVVNGTVTAQTISFGAGGSQLFAQDFGAGDVAQHFMQGDTIATPDIASIAFDAASSTLTIDKQSGAVEHLAMSGADYTGQSFTLIAHQFIILQTTHS